MLAASPARRDARARSDKLLRLVAARPGWFLLILAIALVVRIGVVIATPDFMPVFDAADYDRHATSIADGHGYPGAVNAPQAPTAFRPPLYPLALAGPYAIGGGWTVGRLLGAAFGVLTVALIMAGANMLWGRRTALVAGVIAAVFPPLVLLNASLLSESLFVPLVLAALIAVLKWRDEQRLRWVLLAGLFCGLATLTRSNGLLLVLAALLGVWTGRPRLARGSLVAPALLAAAALVTVTPWLVRTTIVFDRFVPVTTQGGYGLAGTYNHESRAAGDYPGRAIQAEQLSAFRDLFARRDLDEAERGTLLGRRALRYAFEHPGYVPQVVLWNTLRLLELVREGPLKRDLQTNTFQAVGLERLANPLVPISFYLVLLLALGGAAAQAGVLPARRAPPFVWAFPLLTIAPAIGAWGLIRYRAPADPFLVMLAAVGVVAVVERIRERSRSRARSSP